MIFQHTLDKVLSGQKTQTRRIIRPGEQRPRWNVGRVYAVQPSRRHKAVARIEITDVRRQRLGEITQEDAQAEGFSDVAEFAQVWTNIHGHYNPETEVWVVSFRLVGA
jgi:hypothetical protein